MELGRNPDPVNVIIVSLFLVTLFAFLIIYDVGIISLDGLEILQELAYCDLDEHVCTDL
jgi:hypothetical protein